jgi:hypothetical protein
MPTLSREENWISARVGDELVMMAIDSDLYIGLTEVGARVWELIETPQEVDHICARLIAEYDVDPATCRAEVDSFVADLVKYRAARLEAR